MKKQSQFLALFLIACSSGTALATGGPPMATDDPGTPGNRKLEMNVAFTSEVSSTDRRFETPILDLNYGLGEQIQLKYEVPFVISKKEDSGQENGFDRSQAGVKWRFLEKETAGFAMSAYPQFAVAAIFFCPSTRVMGFVSSARYPSSIRFGFELCPSTSASGLSRAA